MIDKNIYIIHRFVADLLSRCNRGPTLSPVYNKFILQTLHSPTGTYFYIYTHTHTPIHIHMHTRAHTLSDTHTHTQTYTPPCSHFNVPYINILTNIQAHFFCTHIANTYVHIFRFCHVQHMHTQPCKHKNTCTHMRTYLWLKSCAAEWAK